MNTVLAFVVVLGVLIFFHELGHFLVARLFGVGVETFSLGFGPRLLGRRVGITDYRLSLIPLGGYVKMVGEEPDAQLDPAQMPISFTHKHVFKRILIVAAGPLFNVLLALLIFTGLSLVHGATVRLASVGEVSPGSPAAQAGLASGDRILAIDGQPVDTWEQMAELINTSGGRPLTFTIQRQEQTLEVQISPEQHTTTNLLGEKLQRFLIGITYSGETRTEKLSLLGACRQSLWQTYQVLDLMVVILSKLITGDISTDTIGGPIMIAMMAGDQARAGATNLITFIAVISINLAVLNLLPIPILDGGHLLFFLIEALKGKPVSLKVREVANQVGLFILMLLMLLVIYNDLARLFWS